MSAFKLFYNFPNATQQNENLSVYHKKPVIVGLIETNVESKPQSNPDCIRYFKLPRRQDYPLNLNKGFENYKFRSDFYYKNKMSKVFRYLMNHHDNDDVENEQTELVESNVDGMAKVDVISHRGALKELLTTPLKIGSYHNKEWTIYATYFEKKLYLSKSTDVENYHHDKGSTYHFKFVQYCFTDDPKNDPETKPPILEGEQMYCIYRSKLNNFNLLYSAEINGIISDKKLKNVKNFDELNQCRFVHTKLMKKAVRNWRTNFRVQNWWAKSYFAAVNDVYVGFKDDIGFVYDPVKHVKLDELVQEQTWSPKACTAFLHKILTEIVKEVKNVNCPYTTFEFHFDSSRNCIEFKKHEGKTGKKFLTDEFIEFLGN